MNNKFFLLIFFVLFMLGCSSVSIKESSINEQKTAAEAEKFYNEWEVEKAQECLEKYELENGKTAETEELRSKISARKISKNNLFQTVEEIKSAIVENRVGDIKRYSKKSFFLKQKIKKLKSYDFEGFQLYSGSYKFDDGRAECIIVANYVDESFYIVVKFRLNDGRWELSDFKERR